MIDFGAAGITAGSSLSCFMKKLILLTPYPGQVLGWGTGPPIHHQFQTTSAVT